MEWATPNWVARSFSRQFPPNETRQEGLHNYNVGAEGAWIVPEGGFGADTKCLLVWLQRLPNHGFYPISTSSAKTINDIPTPFYSSISKLNYL